jgi:hypothetical protein
MATVESGDLSATALEGGVSGLGRGLERLSWVNWVLLGVDGRGELGIVRTGGFWCVWGGWCGGLLSLEGLKHRGWAGSGCTFWVMDDDQFETEKT